MKRLLLFISGITLLSLTSNSQINLEHTFQNRVTVTKMCDGVMYCAHDTNTVYLYNSDYSLYKEVNITPPTNYDLSYIQHVYKGLFNTDNSIEFITTFSNNTDGTSTMKIYNENSDMKKDLGKGYYSRIFSDNGYKLQVSEINPYKTKIYSLPGTLPETSGLKSTKNLKSSKNTPYPNPAKDFVNISFNLQPGEISTLKIFSSSGKFIEQKTIEGHMDRIMLNVLHYNSGVYHYNYMTNNEKKQGKFIVE